MSRCSYLICGSPVDTWPPPMSALLKHFFSTVLFLLLCQISVACICAGVFLCSLSCFIHLFVFYFTNIFYLLILHPSKSLQSDLISFPRGLFVDLGCDERYCRDAEDLSCSLFLRGLVICSLSGCEHQGDSIQVETVVLKIYIQKKYSFRYLECAYFTTKKQKHFSIGFFNSDLANA